LEQEKVSLKKRSAHERKGKKKEYIRAIHAV